MRPVSAWATTASWTCTTPFGSPVVPDVKCSSAMSSEPVRTVSNTSGMAAIAGPSATQPSGAVSPRMRMSFSDGIVARHSATFRRYCTSVVTRTLAPPISIRARTGSGPKAANSGLTTAPAFKAPSVAA